MTVAFLNLDDSGDVVVGFGFGPTVPEGAVFSPDQTDPGQFVNQFTILSSFGGTVQRYFSPRAKSKVPIEQSPGVFKVPGCKRDTTVVFHDIDGNEFMDAIVVTAVAEDIDFTLADPGTYLVEVDEQSPYLPSRTTIVIGA